MTAFSPTRWNVSGMAFLAFCSATCSGPPPWGGHVEVAEGVEVVSNPREPLLGESEGMVVELWTVQGAEWVNPSAVHAAGGLVTVVDPPANQVHLVSGSGEVLPSLGRTGGGPGEFLHLVDAFQDGHRITALDAGRGTVEYFGMDGVYHSSVKLEGQVWSGFPFGESGLMVKGEFLSDPSRETLGDWFRVEEDGKLTAFAPPALAPLPEEQGVQCFDLSAWGDGTARMRYTTPQIQVFNSSGALIQQVFIDLPVEEVTGAERKAALSGLEHSLVDRGMPPPFIEQNLIVMEERWRVKCRFGPLRFDPSRRLAAFLEQNPEDFGSGNATLHFLSRDGVYLAKGTFTTPWKDFTMEDGVVYALTQDPTTGLSTLAAFRLDLPASVLDDATKVLRAAR